jgi:protein-tyrosine-phosphatase
VRLAIVDELRLSDRSPLDLREQLGIESNLLTHHLDVLEQVGLIERTRSSGDGRRRYVHLRGDAMPFVDPCCTVTLGPALFVCTANSARSQLAAALWEADTGQQARSAGTDPAGAVSAGAVAAAARIGLDLRDAVPTPLDAVGRPPALVVTVCDRAHEQLEPHPDRLHWSVPDPVPDGRAAAFDRVVTELRERIARITSLAVAS